MCIFPEREWNGAKVKGAICTDAHSHWAPGPKPGTIAWKGFWCLDNASGKAEVSPHLGSAISSDSHRMEAE